MRKGKNLFALIVALALVAAACSSGGGDSSALCDGSIDDGTVTVWTNEGAEADAYVQLAEDFNATVGTEKGIVVELTLVPEGGYTDAVNAAAAAGDLPDVILFDGPTLANFAWAGSLVPIDGCVPDDSLDNMLPSVIAAGTYEGNLYSVATFDSGLGLWAYRSALEEVGARIPTNASEAWSTAEFEQILRDLQGAGYEKPLDIKIFYGTQGEWMTYGFSPIAQSAGGDLVDRNTLKAEGVLNSQDVVDALTVFQKWATDGLIATDAVDDSVFLEKKSPLSWVGHWMYNTYKETLGDDLVLLPLPDFGEGTRTGMGSWAWGITKNATDGDAAWEFLSFATSDDTILAVTGVNGAVPATKTALAKSPNYAEGGDLVLFAEQLAGAPDIAVPRPVTPGYPTVTSEFWGAMDKILLGGDVQAALDTAAANIDADVDANEGYPAP